MAPIVLPVEEVSAIVAPDDPTAPFHSVLDVPKHDLNVCQVAPPKN